MVEATGPDAVGRGRVAGKVALVTGGGSGIGRGCARLLAAEGARVMVSDLDHATAQAVAAEVGDDARDLTLDVRDELGWRRGIATTLEAHGRLDILVNAAGRLNLASIEDESLTDFRELQAVNVEGVFLGCKFAIDAMRRTTIDKSEPGGSIINLSSVSGLIGGHNLAAYNASKGAVRLLTKSVALYCARKARGVRCNSVHPAFIDTPMVDRLVGAVSGDPEEVREKLAQMVPLGRIGTVDDVAYAVLYLASDESAFMTGSELVIDGGMTAQ